MYFIHICVDVEDVGFCFLPEIMPIGAAGTFINKINYKNRYFVAHETSYSNTPYANRISRKMQMLRRRPAD